MKQKQIPQTIEDFALHLIELKDYQSITNEIKEQIKEDLVKRINDYLIAVIVARIPKDKLEEYEKLLDEGESEKIQNFNEVNIPDFQKVITDALIKFKSTYLGIE